MTVWTMEYKLTDYPCLSSISACLMLSIIYVSSLYVWNSPHHRDHPSTIKKRFFSVFVMMFIAPMFLYYFSHEHILRKASIWQLLGLRVRGLVPAVLTSLILTMMLFLGPLCMQGFSGLWRLHAEPMYWVSNFQNLIWVRNHIVAPLSEEFTFRACMLPLLLQCFQPITAIFVCPLFFGIGEFINIVANHSHFHHMAERMRNGMDFTRALMLSCFQLSYTTIFGAYSAFLFFKTGHFVAPLTAHAFCNHMGFPDFAEILTYKDPRRCFLIFLYVIGLVAWCALLDPLTNPAWYSNEIYKRNYYRAHE
uniref:CAAX prenyl protease 2 n=1 Tax=Timema cristinae TaxID=61476 RepID=A0A7R9CB90_TIMCR|nr:unnamed protein product [Timema cristinae]